MSSESDAALESYRAVLRAPSPWPRVIVTVGVLALLAWAAALGSELVQADRCYGHEGAWRNGGCYMGARVRIELPGLDGEAEDPPPPLPPVL